MKTLAADLDGTIYKGNLLLPKVKETYDFLKNIGINIIFLTNNSSQTPAEIKSKLEKLLKVEINIHSIVTPLNVLQTVDELVNSKVYIFGSSNIENYIKKFNKNIVPIDKAESIIIGRKEEVDFNLVNEIASFILSGKKAFCLNKDLTFPTEKGEKPGNGAVVKILEELTNMKVESLGKPDQFFINYLKNYNYEINYVIGDRVDTDIILANKLKIESILIRSGVTNFMNAENATYVIDEFDELIKILFK